MKDIKKYYENTKDAGPYPMVEKFINMNIKPTNAIELGCGAGRDTRYLIKNGWNVLAIDRENNEEMILNKLNNEEIERFEFECQTFEDIKLRNTNLLVANFSIPFCNKKYFNIFWNKIINSIQKERLFCWEFFRDKRFMGKSEKANGISYKRAGTTIV